MGLGSALGAGAGADMLQEILRQKAAEAFKLRDQNLEQQRLQQQQQYQNSILQSQQEARDDAAKSRAGQRALKIAGVLKPGSQIDPTAVAALNEGDLGGLVQHTDATLGSRNITGSVQSGQTAPRIVGLASTANPGQAAKDTYTGTDAQLAAEQAVKDHADQIEQARQDRIAAQAQAEAARQELARIQASLKPERPAPRDRFSTAQGTDGNGKPVIIRTNMDTGEVSVLPLPAGTTPRATGAPVKTPAEIEAEAAARARGTATGKKDAGGGGLLSAIGNVFSSHEVKPSGPAVGEKRTINGQMAQWDGHGWLPVS